MEENVALDSNKQKQFVKSIKGIKKLIKKNATGPKPPTVAKPVSAAKEKKLKFRERGLVYLSHIPHGFYENEMTQYFKQFGKVTNVRVIRSKRTGNSRGCAFVEFSEPAVAQIVAETMNNYLMGKRLIKAAIVPVEKQRRYAVRKNWNPLNNPGTESRLKQKKIFNAKKTHEEDLRRARTIVKTLDNTKKRLKEMGIDYDFFTPVDVPEDLNELEAKRKNDSKKSKQHTKLVEVSDKKEKPKKVERKPSIAAEVNASSNQVVNQTKKSMNKKKPVDAKIVEQLGKKEKIKGSGMKLPEQFIKVAQSESEDDSDDESVEFDSDEFDKAQEFDEEFDSEAEESGSESEEGSDEKDDNDDEDDDESSEDEPATPKKGPLKPKQQPPPKAGKGKAAVPASVAKKNLKPKPVHQPQLVQNSSQDKKRKAPQKPEVSTKKQKFEKKGKQQAKQFKKK